MPKILRSIAAVIAGLALAFVLVVAVEGFSAVVHPFPPGVDQTNYDVCKAHVANYPGWVLGVAALCWGITVFVSAWLATRLGTGRHLAHGLVVGAVLLAMVIFNMAMLPYPGWFWIANLVAFPVAGILGSRLGKRRP